MCAVCVSACIHIVLLIFSSSLFSKICLLHYTCTPRHTNRQGCDGFCFFVSTDLCLRIYNWYFPSTTMAAKSFTVEEGWEYVKNNGITKLIRILEGLPEPSFSPAEYMMLYTYPFFLFFLRFFVYLHWRSTKNMNSGKK